MRRHRVRCVSGRVDGPGLAPHDPCTLLDVARGLPPTGGTPVWTPQVLALLARLDVRATFCVIGQNVVAHPDLVQRVLDGGHQIANHTYTHPMNLAVMARPQVDDQLHRTTDLLTQAGHGVRPTLFRAPGGAWSRTILDSAAAAGMRALDWSVDTRDWSRPGTAHIVDVLLTRTHPGSIILDHDGGGDRSQTVAALGTALPRLLDQGYRFVLP
ncbi:MAG TPA: polysaccharide deacetylase family protein [Kineosporiaceae bacterium]